MKSFVIDRLRLPKPWDRPLIFHARNGEIELEIEVEEDAGIDYAATPYATRLTSGRSLGLAADIRETFSVLVETAVNVRLADDPSPPERIVLTSENMDFR